MDIKASSVGGLAAFCGFIESRLRKLCLSLSQIAVMAKVIVIIYLSISIYLIYIILYASSRQPITILTTLTTLTTLTITPFTVTRNP